MTIEQGKQILDQLLGKAVLDEDETFAFIEVLEYLIRETNDDRYMMTLGGYYYEQKEFDLALKYYNMAASLGNVNAYEGLAYIWYYGRTGTVDYKLAFENYSKAAEKGVLEAKYKLADMYKNGYYVQKDFDKYRSLIKSLYEQIKDSNLLFDPVPEVCMRYGHILKDEGDIQKALELFFHARSFFEQRLKYQNFFGTYNNIRWAIESIYELLPVDEEDLTYFDLYAVLKDPVKVHLQYHQKTYCIESVMEEGRIIVSFDHHWFESIKDLA